MNKLYSVHDHWTDIAKKNDVDIESIDGVIAGIKVNGEDYGGGSSDFSTAEVTIVWKAARKTVVLYGATIQNNLIACNVFLDGEMHENFEAILYQQKAVFRIDNAKTTASVSVIGNAELSDGYIEVTGDCILTIS